MNKGLGQKILALRELGYSYNKISKELGCAKSSVTYHIGIGQKVKNRQRAIKNGYNVRLTKKINCFIRRYKKSYTLYINKEKELDLRLRDKIQSFRRSVIVDKTSKFGLKELKDKINNTNRCELSGRAIDIQNTTSWHLDHKIPISKGGDNSLENCAILCREANQAKHDMTKEEFLLLCKDVLEFNGFQVVPVGYAPT